MDHEEGKFFTTGRRLLELLKEFDNTVCQHDCRVEVLKENLIVNITIHGCRDHASCFAKMLAAERTIQ